MLQTLSSNVFNSYSSFTSINGKQRFTSIEQMPTTTFATIPSTSPTILAQKARAGASAGDNLSIPPTDAPVPARPRKRVQSRNTGVGSIFVCGVVCAEHILT